MKKTILLGILLSGLSFAADKPADFKPLIGAAKKEAAPQGALDKLLDGNLEKLEGKKLSKVKELAHPEKYYVFYYSASWCQPCHQFTPSLVEFYNKNKNAQFEIYLITSDQEEKAMEGYVAEAKMPWPVLSFRKVEKFKKEINHGVDGIPFLAICNPDGTVVEKGNAGTVLGKLQSLVGK
ncbi:thioredoxin-like domain-containing protein [Haloferula sp. BvORR071]|uniref:thioredoxin-like domain-containing protein n=1 Tax=Haloferula sp. BvORR071 TaxID=1396141 RepID=UPI00054EEE93|nr:thioredoxin-like domain-containing protein [Haloferula sp. BvORR071]